MHDCVGVYLGEALAAYHFGHAHPFGPSRHGAFERELRARGLDRRVCILPPEQATREQLLSFHDAAYVAAVAACSGDGRGWLDCGDTPAFTGMYEAAATVVGTTLAALSRVMSGACTRAFVPIAGLHHARRDGAAGFCIFNDCGVAIEALLRTYAISPVAYVDIDAHHGDGVYDAYAADPRVLVVDIHEDGRYLYPGTGGVEEQGTGQAAGTKLNIPLPPHADDAALRAAWPAAERFLDAHRPKAFVLQCGADGLAGDPLTHLRYSAESHGFVARRLLGLAARHAQGRLLALGGGGYEPANIAAAWCAVVEALVEADGAAPELGSRPPEG